MKLLFVTDPLVTTAGAVRPALLLGKQMSKWGHDVEIASTQFAEPIIKTLKLDGIRHSFVGSGSSMVRSFPTFRAWAASLVKPVRMTLKNEDVYVINTSSCVLADSAVYYAQGTMTRTLDEISKNFPLAQQYAYYSLSPWLKFLEHRLVAGFRRLSVQFVANSHFCSSIYREWGFDVDRVIYPPLDTELFKASTSNPSEDFVLTHLGSFEKEGKFALIKAIASFGVKVKVFGAAPSRFRRAEHKNITFLGRVSDRELVDLYSNAMFTLFAFSHEPFGYIPAESMACGTPVLTFNRQGPGETVTDGQTGWLAKTDDEVVAKAVQIWKRGIDRRIRDSCRKKALDYDVKHISKIWIELLKNREINRQTGKYDREPQQRSTRIIVASPSLNMVGGAQRVCLHTIKALRKTGCRIALSTIDKTDWALVGTIFGETAKPDEELYLFSRMPKTTIVTFRQALIASSYALRLFIITMTNKANIVLNMGGELADNFGDLVYVNAIPLRLMHVFPQIQPVRGVQWSIYSRLYSAFLRFFGKGAGIMVANSSYTQDIINKYIGKRALVVNPPVVSRKILSGTSTNVRKNTVVTISRFRSAKCLAVIPEVANFVKDCEFVLIGTFDSGSGQCLRELSEEIDRLRVQDRVHIFKNKPQSYTLDVLRHAKVFLHTQVTEAFGMSVVESMAAGCVPVVPRGGGPWTEILGSQEGLYGFSYRSPSEAADKIRLLIKDEKLRREVSARATQRAMVFDSSVFEAKLLTILETFSVRNKCLLT